MKLFYKTFIYTLTLLILIALSASLLIYFLLPPVYTNFKQQNLTSQAEQMAQRLQTSKREDIVNLMGIFAASGQTNININVGGEKYALIVWSNAAGTDGVVTSYVTVTSDTGAESDVSTDNVVLSGNYDTYSSIATAEGSLYDVTSGLSTAKTISARRGFTMDGEEGSLKLSMTLAPVDEAVGVIMSLLPLSIFLCVLIAVVFSLLYARSISRPIKAISGITRRMTALERDARCAVKSKDELGELAANVNGLYENLLSTISSLEAELKKVADAEKAKTDFLRAASHELKTPVTAAGVIIDNMILGVGKYKNHGEWLPKCRDLLLSLSEKLREILDASRLDEISEPYVTENLDTVCTEILEPFLLIARAKGLNLYIDWSAAFPVTAPPKLLGKALSSIFANAVQYTAEGGKFSVYCRGRGLIVENECTPIPEDELSRLFEPFYRPDLSRSRETGGNGLGLYIVDTVLRRLGLSYRFEPMSAPEGMRFSINF